MIRVLTGATLIDGTGAAPVPDAAVVIDRDRITAAGPRAALTWPPDAEIIDGRGRTVIPGLIDAHDHLASHGYGLATRFGLDEPASTAHLRTARVLAETLAMGYTTVRDAGGLDAGFKLAVEQGLLPHERKNTLGQEDRSGFDTDEIRESFLVAGIVIEHAHGKVAEFLGQLSEERFDPARPQTIADHHAVDLARIEITRGRFNAESPNKTDPLSERDRESRVRSAAAHAKHCGAGEQIRRDGDLPVRVARARAPQYGCMQGPDTQGRAQPRD